MRGRSAQAELFGRSGGGTRRSPVAIVAVAALVVGAAVGAYFWGGRVESTNTDTARARVALGATFTQAENPATPDQFEIDYTNYGQYPLTIGTVKFDEFGLVATPASTGIEIAPGKTAEQKISVKPDCTAIGNPQSWTPATTATVAVTTADGVDRTAKVNLLSRDPRMTGLFSQVQSACGWQYLTFGDLNFSVEGVETKGDTVVSHLVFHDPFDSFGTPPTAPTETFSIVLDSVNVGEGGHAYAVSTEFPLPAALPPDRRFDLVWKVDDCARAQQAISDDMDLHVHGSVNGKGQGEITISTNYPSLVAQLLRLTFATCGLPGG